MSADDFIVHSHRAGNFCEVFDEGKKWLVGGTGNENRDEYMACAQDADGLILLTSEPCFMAGVEEVVEKNPQILVYATSAGLRNAKEIINRDINEKLIKDNLQVGGLKFIVTPNLRWVDTCMAVFGGRLMSGEMFSQKPDMERFYRDNLAVNSGFVLSALDRLEDENIDAVFPAYGEMVSYSDAIGLYRGFVSKTEKAGAVVVFHSAYGYTKAMAEFVAEKLGERCKVKLLDAAKCDRDAVIDAINHSRMLAVGTNTVDRNAPKEIWDIITGLDLVNDRNMPYFVFGSFGWAGDGMKLVDKTLAAMGMRRTAKPVEVLFKPNDKDFCALAKAVEKLAAE